MLPSTPEQLDPFGPRIPSANTWFILTQCTLSFQTLSMVWRTIRWTCPALTALQNVTPQMQWLIPHIYLDHLSTPTTTLLWKWKWCDIRPSMVTHSLNSCSAFNPKCTHTAVNTHTVNTHSEQWAAIYAAAPGEQSGVRCLAQGHLSRGTEGGESAGHSLPTPTITAGPRLELATFGLRVRLSNH